MKPLTTNTTNSQAESIDTPEFHELLWDYSYSVSDFGASYSKDERAALIAHIDAKLAQAEARATAAESRAEKAEQYTQVALGIKDSLEARLAEIQRGVEGLQRYGFDGTFSGDFGKNSLGCYVKADAVFALLQPQGQADTSGLPG